MLQVVFAALSRDPSDFTRYINAVTSQEIERTPGLGYKGDSCIGGLYAVLQSGFDFFDSRKRTVLFLPAYPRPIVLRAAFVQAMTGKNDSTRLQANEEEMDAIAASRSNRVDVLQKLLQREGIDALNLRDKQGHTAAHWAALEGHADVISFMINNNGPFDAISSHPLKQRPIHWATVNGHIPVIELLLTAGVSVDVTDSHGCTPLITACQYAQTSAAAFLMGKGAMLQACDAEGDNALHWAAFRGRPELVRLLIYSGFNPHQRDHQGQGPLHLAAIAGSLSTVRDLCQIDRVSIDVCDANGRTPLMLAKGRRHDDVSAYLQNETNKREGSVWAKINLKSLAFGPPGKKREAQLGFIFICLIIMYPTYLFKVAPTLYADSPLQQWIFVALNVLGAVGFIKASQADPGFIERRHPDYDRIMQQVGSYEAWSVSGQSVLERLCHTCRIVKPFRAKHCRICDRCVNQMDHHCPYIYNCVGFGNRAWFFCFIYATLSIALMSFYFGYQLFCKRGIDLLSVIVLPFGLFGVCVVGMVGLCLWYNAARNITTNEMANKHRYSYLRNGHGHFRNPFDRGLVTNVLEFFHLKPPMPIKDYHMQRIADIL